MVERILSFFVFDDLHSHGGCKQFKLDAASFRINNRTAIRLSNMTAT